MSLIKYLMQTEVHTYAFSVAANAILSLFPFIVMMFTLARRVFHSPAMEDVIGAMLLYFLPANQDFVVRNMSLLPMFLVSYIVGRWHRYARSGFARQPDEHADAQLRLILQ